MIGMMMRDQNPRQGELVTHQIRLHARGFTGIDDPGLLLVVQQPDVVVVECGERNNIHQAMADFKNTQLNSNPSADSIIALSQWFDSAPGRYVLNWEQQMFDAAVADIFGFNAVQVGLPEIDALNTNRMPLVIYAGHHPVEGAARSLQAQVLSDFEELPFASQSLDLVVLPHILEFASEPHQVLREVERVLIPEGQVVISGFNPISLWGVRQRISRRIAAPFLPQAGRFISVPRLKDWLKLLSFEIERGRFGCYRPPCRTDAWLARTAFMEKAGDRWWGYCGATYMIVGVKRVRSMRLIGPAWRDRKARAQAAAIATQSVTSDRMDMKKER